MKGNTGRIRATHTGSMPRPPEILAMMRAKAAGGPWDCLEFDTLLKKHVVQIVRRQVDAGIDVVNDGECGKTSFMNYVAERLAGFEGRGTPSSTGPINAQGRDAKLFPDYYAWVLEHNPFADIVRTAPLVCVAAVSYAGRKDLARDIENLKSAMAAAGADEGFLPAASPIPTMRNEHYASEEEFWLAYGQAMREEYKAILDAGLYLQIDDPRMVSTWDGMNDASLAGYRKWMQKRVAHITMRCAACRRSASASTPATASTSARA
jgi:5-methyltetrahydropteroyltriglutamate--homocysteine methyltransferase